LPPRCNTNYFALRTAKLKPQLCWPRAYVYRVAQSHRQLCSRGLNPLPPRCNTNYFALRAAKLKPQLYWLRAYAYQVAQSIKRIGGRP
jgi:hypothetical protein